MRLRRVRIHAGIALAICIITLGLVACSDDDAGEPSPEAPSPSATALAPDANAAQEVFHEFVELVAQGDVPKAWALYAASIPGTISEYREDMGCPFEAFQSEFPKMQHLFARTAPFEVKKSFGTGSESVVIELELRAANDTNFLGTLLRVAPTEGYRLRFLNSGQVAAIPGQPDPLPSPEDPQGYCGIWTGGR